MMTILLEVNMVDIIHRIGIKSPTTQVYNALTSLEGLGQWWTDEVQGEEQVGGKIELSVPTEMAKKRFSIIIGEKVKK
jgi:uncharacterized protein YndB with AHSA1/START domain